jgi:hypothetical protein
MMSHAQIFSLEPTPVDDVRRIRERLSREAGGDMVKYARQSQDFLESHKDELKKLKLRMVPVRESIPAPPASGRNS